MKFFLLSEGKEKYCEAIRKYSGANDPNEETPFFLEATIFSKEKAVLLLGDLAEKPADSSKINKVGLWFKPWFYKHVETSLKKGEFEEFIPIREYLFR